MSILGNIRYRMNTPTAEFKQTGVGELASLQQNQYELATFRYPYEGLGQTDAPHYILFNINVPEASKYVPRDVSGVFVDTPSASTEDFKYLQGKGLIQDNPQTSGRANPKGSQQVIGKTAVLNAAVGATKRGISPTGVIGDLAVGEVGARAIDGSIHIAPQLKRIATSIALYMPDSQLVAQYDHNWGAVSLTDALGLAGIASAFVGEFRALTGGTFMENITNAGGELKKFWEGNLHNSKGLGAGQAAEVLGTIAEKSGVGGPGIKELIMRSASRAINPQVQMVFSSTANREFTFEFDFQVRSQQEAVSVHQIINTFKRFAAPEIADNSAGRYFIPPAQFDIKFFFKENENPFIAKISTCALTRIIVDYNKSPPFATFDDGMPVHINLLLGFREMDIITRELIEHFGY